MSHNWLYSFVLMLTVLTVAAGVYAIYLNLGAGGFLWIGGCIALWVALKRFLDWAER